MALEIVIIGAASVAATALAKQGHAVTIYERERSTTEMEYAFRITANSDRYLKNINVDTVAGGASEANTSRALDVKGNIIREVQENRSSEQVPGGVSVFASRPALVKQTIDEAVSCGVKIENGFKVNSVDIEKTGVVLDGGSRVTPDLIVAADGLHSVVRSQVVDTAIYRPRPTLSQNCFRWTIPTSAIKADEELSELYNKDFHMISWTENSKRLVSYPVDFDHSVTNNDETSSAAVSYDKRVPIGTVKNIYSEFEPRVHRLIGLADPNGFRIWKLQDMNEIPQWSVNRTIIIGDAAHAVLPFGFSGASMAIEDAVILAEFLPLGVQVEDLPSRLKLLEQTRKPRVSRVREHSRAAGSGQATNEDMAAYMEFLCECNAVADAKTVLRAHLNSNGRTGRNV